MTKEQKKFKGLILADLKIAISIYADSDKAMRLLAAYHVQQAIEKTIKLKAEIEGLNLWGHNIGELIKNCDDSKLDIGIPSWIRNNARSVTGWEAECRYYPIKSVRKDTIKKAYDLTREWLESGKTK